MTSNTKSANGIDISNPFRYVGEYTFATICKPGEDKVPLFEKPIHQILFDLGARVWVLDHTNDALLEGIVVVSDGVTNGIDYHGSRVLSVPIEWCHLYDAKQVEAILYLIEINSWLLRFGK